MEDPVAMDLRVDTAITKKDVDEEVANVQSGDEQTTVMGNGQMIMQEALEENAGTEKGFAKDECRGDSEMSCKGHEDEPRGEVECQLSGENDPVLSIIKNEDVKEDTIFRADQNLRSEHHEDTPKVNMGSDLSGEEGLGLTMKKLIKNDDVHGETIEADRNLSTEEHKGTSEVEKNCHESGEKEDPGLSNKISIKKECMEEDTICANRSCSCEDHDDNHDGGMNGDGDHGLTDTKSCVIKVDDMKGMDIPDVELSSKDHVDNPESNMAGRSNGNGLTNHPRIPKEDDEDEKDFDDRKLSLDDPDDYTKEDEEYGGDEDLEDVLQSGESFWCSLCDDGGNLLFCDGPCLRSFHACLSQQEKEEGKDCITLGFTEKQFKAIESEMTTWLCPNCEANSQLCFICGKLGKSAGPKKEVFNCDAAHCGQFYHPMCVARALTKNVSKQREYADKIGQGVETFLCPLHKCKSCKQLEDGTDRDMQFAKCRRCPTSWHVKCLPSTMSFEDDEYLDIPQRAWRVPVGDEEHQFRVGIYCPKHELPLEPSDMVRFPYSPVSYFKLADHITSQQEALSKKSRKPKAVDHPASEKEKRTSAKERRASQQQSAKVKISASESTKEGGTQVQGSSDVQKSSARQLSSESKQRQHRLSTVTTGTYIEKLSASQLSDIQKRIDEIVLRSQELMTAEKIKQELRTPRYYGDKKAGPEGGKFIHDGELSSILNVTIQITLSVPSTNAKVLSKWSTISQSIPKALNCLTKGSGIAEAKCLCPVKSITQLDRVEKAMTVYLNPCLHGQRYTSFGRHFTVKDKLIETVDRLQWYINDKDVIVDFCCGANDFSVEVRRKLILAGKKNCEYKNFDILAPKNDFEFEQRDWFSVQHNELPIGDKLIIGLNPPFGVRSSIANSFIDWAVTFRPKIIILIVPPETKRLESSGYELIWADADLLRGKSFYLPGSVNTGDSMLEDWNKTAPPLYLWSRSDWADKHRQMAVKQGHVKAMGSALQNQQNDLSPCFQPRNPAFNPDFKPVKEMVRPSHWDSNDLRSPWSSRNIHCYRAELYRPLPEHTGPTSRLSSHFSAPHTNELLNKNPVSTGCALVEASMPNHTSYSVLKESPENPLKDTGKEFPHPRPEDAPTKAVADVESDDVKKPIGEPLMSNKPDKSKSEPQTRTSVKRPLKTDGTSEKGDERSKQTPRPKKQLKRAHPSSIDEPAHRPNLQARENSHASEPLEEPLLNVVHRSREEGNNRRNWDVHDAKGTGESCDRKGHEASESSRDFINMSDRRSTRNPEIGNDTSHREDRALRRSGNERGRPCEGEAKVYQDPKERRRSVGSGEKRALVNSREETDKDPSARKSQDSNGMMRSHNDFDKMRKSAESHDVKAFSDSRVKRPDDESNHRNLKDFVKTTLCVDELVIRPKHEVFDVEKDPKRKDRDDADKHKSRRGSHGNREEMAKDHSRRGIHGREHGEKLHPRGLGGRKDADKGNSRKAMHGREDITEKVHSKIEILGREDAEKGQVRRGIPDRTEAYEDYLRIRELRGREDDDRGRSRRDSHGWEDAEKSLPRKQNYVREDIDKGHPRDARELGIGKGRPKRDFNGLDQVHEHGSGRILGPAVITKRKFEGGEGRDQRDIGNLGDFEKQNWRNNLRRFDDDVVDMEAAAGGVRVFQGKGPSYCTGEQPALAGLTLPKWFTTRSNTGSLLDVGHPVQDVVLPSAVEAEHLETDTIKYPTLHGSDGVRDPSPTPAFSTRYPDFNQARSYGVHEQSLPRTNYSDNYGMNIHSYDTHALDFADIQGIRPLSPPSGLHSFDFGNLTSGRMYGVHHDSSSWKPPMGPADHINHQPQEMSLDWPRLDTNPHLYQDNIGGITGSLTGAQLDPPLDHPFDDDESLASRSNYNPDQFSFAARDNHLSAIGRSPPRFSLMSNDFLGTRNALLPSSEGLWSSTPFSFPSQSANMGSQNIGIPTLSWREPRPYLNF